MTQATLAETVESEIIDLVQRQQLKPGELLPGEIELAQQFACSRGIVREAITRLQGLGLVVRRKNRGTMLAEPDVFSRLRRYMVPQFYSDASIVELFEMRYILEIGAAGLICERIDDAELHGLEDLIHREQRAKSPRRLAALDCAFHGRLYACTGNHSLAGFQALLEPFFRRVVEDDRRLGRQTGRVGHRELLNVLSSRDTDRFRDALEEHLAPYRLRYHRDKTPDTAQAVQ